MRDSIERAMQAQLETALGISSTTTKWGDQPPLTVDSILDAIALLPPKETWVVSRLFPPNQALIAKTPGENFTCFNDGTWERVRRDLRSAQINAGDSNPLHEIRPVFIDADADDPVDYAEWRARERKCVLDCIAGTIAAEAELSRVLT